MLTKDQKQYLAKIPKDKIAKIGNWDPNAAKFAKSLVEEITKNSGLEVLWEGSLALGIDGENDIDLYVFSEPNEFQKHLPDVIKTLGDPTYVLKEKILWRIIKEGYKVDASLISPNSEPVKKDKYFFETLKKDQELLDEYKSLKVPGMSARDYYKKKNEFYNKIIKTK